jgi:tetratricopeptide (TPR) repeat protein
MQKYLFALIPSFVISTLSCSCVRGEDIKPASQGDLNSIKDANQFLWSGDYKKAEAIYRTLVNGDTDGSAFTGLIVAQAKLDLAGEAENSVYQAKERFPRSPDIRAAAGFVSYIKATHGSDSGKRDIYLSAAENLCQSAIKENPDSLVAYQTIGLTKVALSEPEQAVTSFRRCVDLARTPENLTNLAVVLRKSDFKNKEGAKLISQALLLNNDYFPAHIAQAAILLNENKRNNALTELQLVPETQRDAQWSLIAGDIYSQKGDYNSAFALWNNAVRLDPYLSDTYQHMADYYASHGENALAVTELKRGLDVNPFNKTLREQLSKQY